MLFRNKACSVWKSIPITQMRLINEEVLYPDERVVAVTRQDVLSLKQRAAQNARRRVRFCAHATVEDALHEMLIVLSHGVYVRPHQHTGRVESFHVIEGVAELTLFDDSGVITGVVPLGTFRSGRCFYCRVPDQVFHTLSIRSHSFVFHETKTGPFDPATTVFAPWSPSEQDVQGSREFHRKLDKALADFQQHRTKPIRRKTTERRTAP